MNGKTIPPPIIALATALAFVPVALAATIDPASRTVTTATMFVAWSESNPEEIRDIRWNGSANLTNTGVSDCGDPLEYFGNSWASPDSADFVSLVGWGQSGTWSPSNKGVSVKSASASASGCFGALDVPIETKYKFWDQGPVANRIQVQRTFDFGATPFADDFRPYIPRLYPLDGFTEVHHPDAAGTSLLQEDPSACPFGCRVDDWDGTWFAIHDPSAGRGLIVRHAASPWDVALWVDEDLASFTNATAALVLAPDGGFTGSVVDVQFLCFYDSASWTPSLDLPPGC